MKQVYGMLLSEPLANFTTWFFSVHRPASWNVFHVFNVECGSLCYIRLGVDKDICKGYITFKTRLVMLWMSNVCIYFTDWV